jgi:hypothetical protein
MEHSDLQWSGKNLALIAYPAEKLDLLRQEFGFSIDLERDAANPVILDEGTMAVWNLELGNKIALVGFSDDGRECVAEVSGTSRPFHGGAEEEDGAGLILVPTGVCADVVRVLMDDNGFQWLNFHSSELPGSSRLNDLASVFFDNPEITGALIAILLVALAMWGLALSRTVSHTSATASVVALSLVRQGWAPKRARRAFTVLILAMAVPATALACVITRFILLGIVGFYTQVPLLAIVAVLMVFFCWLVCLARLRSWPTAVVGKIRKGSL